MMRTRRYWLVRGLLLLAALGTEIPCAAQSAAAAAPDPIAVANSEFRERYSQARSEALARTGPVIVVHEGDKVVLLHAGKRTVAVFVPPSDAVLKSVAHVPLGLFVTLDGPSDRTIDAAGMQVLRRYREKVDAAAKALDSRGLPGPTLARQKAILAESLAFLDGVIAADMVPAGAARRFARRMGPLVLENISEAARAQLDGLHARVVEWRARLTPAEWASLRVVVIGVHMAREDELATQYFLRLLGEEREGDRVVYAEGLWEEATALDLLGTHILDGRAGEAFFGSAMRMHRDVLGDEARAYLDVLGVGP